MFRRDCQIHSFRFAISTHCRQLEHGLASLYPALSTTAGTGKCRAEWSIESRYGKKTGDWSYVSYEDGNLIHDAQLIDDALDYLEWRITTRILREMSQFVQIHAAGLVRGGKALLLVGPSGAGKSSLALCMLLEGWKCLSDEVILIDGASETVWPLPRSFRLDTRTMESFPELLAKRSGPLYHDSTGKMRLDPSVALGDWVAKPSQPGWIIFPSYRPASRGEIGPLGETEALSLMLSQAINLAEHGKRGLDILINLVRRFQCFRLNAGDLHTATSMLGDLTKQVHRPDRSYPASARSSFSERGVTTTILGGSYV